MKMSEIRQIERSEWNEPAFSEYIATIPFSPDELEAHYLLSFFDFYDEGIGICRAAYVDINGTYFFLNNYPKNDKTREFTHVLVRSTEQNSSEALGVLIEFFDVSKSMLPDISKHLGEAKWELIREDDNANVFVIDRFLNEQSARITLREYSKNHHKQSYSIRIREL